MKTQLQAIFAHSSLVFLHGDNVENDKNNGQICYTPAHRQVPPSQMHFNHFYIFEKWSYLAF